MRQPIKKDTTYLGWEGVARGLRGDGGNAATAAGGERGPASPKGFAPVPSKPPCRPRAGLPPWGGREGGEPQQK